MDGGHRDEPRGHHAAAHPREKHPCSGDARQAGAEGPCGEGSERRHSALGPVCKAEAGLATVPMVACGIPQWPGAARRLPLPASASSSSSSTPGSSVGTSSRFALCVDPSTKRRVRTPVGTWPLGTARAQSRPADGHPTVPSLPALPAPGAHGSARGSLPALWVPTATLWLQEGCQAPALPAAGRGRLVPVPPAPPPPPRPAVAKGGQGEWWGTHEALRTWPDVWWQSAGDGWASVRQGIEDTRRLYGCVGSDPKLQGRTRSWPCTSWNGSTGFSWGG